MLKFDAIPLNDEKTYHLLGMGLTKGVFQLEEHLGERYCQVVKPRCIEDIADITAIIRPGCKEAFHVDGKTTMLEAYCKIRNGEMEEAYLHDDLKQVLGKTYSVLIYQEQITEVCMHMAGMTLEEGDMVRYAMGKKRPELMAEWKEPFTKGCVKKGYTQELADKMWDWIEKSAKYLFNKSHAIAYGLTAYKTAYAKTNYPTAFYTAMLKYADKKIDTYDEMQQLINDAKLFDIRVSPPRIQDANADFLILDNKNITFGIRYLKGVGEHGMSAIERLKGVTSWYDFLCGIDRFKVDKTSTEALIKAGVLDAFNLSRMQMMAEYEMFRELTRNEQVVVLSLISGVLHPEILIEIDSADFAVKRTVTKYIKLHKTGIFDVCGRYGPIAGLPLPANVPNARDMNLNLYNAIECLIASGVPTGPRCEKLQAILNTYTAQAPYTPNVMTYQIWEKFYFGIPLTSYDKMLVADPQVTPCIEIINIMPDQNVTVIGEIEKVSLAKIKRGDSKGKTMAFIDIADNSYMLKGVIAFSECYEKHGKNIVEGLPVRIKGRKMRDSNSILAFSVERL